MKLIGIMVAASVLGCCLLAGCVNGCGEGYSTGERRGTIVKFSHKGFSKSWEGDMVLGGVVPTSSNGGIATNVWSFHVSDAMADKVLEAYRAGKPVTIHYSQWVLQPWWQFSEYDVVSITPANE